MNAGDTYRYTAPGDDPHTWVVFSEPKVDPSKVASVNITSWAAYKEQICELNAGDHDSVKHRSVVYYKGAMVHSLEQLTELKSKSWIVVGTPVSAEVLKKIREGAGSSKFMAMEVWEILESQGLT